MPDGSQAERKPCSRLGSGHAPLLPLASHPITTLSSTPKAKFLECEGL